jgi:hypothetical protein
MLPDISWTEITNLCELRPFAVSSNAQIYYYKDGRPKVYKFHGTQREIDMMLIAGDCSVRPCERVVSPELDGTWSVEGFTMIRETPLNVMAIDPVWRLTLMHGMISCVLALHARGIVHGDIKPANMLFCSDSKVRLCDFAEARPLNENPADWEGTVTVNYTSPHRCQTWPDSRDLPPVVEDDLYALGLSIWELHTGTVPFDGVYEDDIRTALKAGQTVNVSEVTDEAVRAVISGYLRYGGARV